MADSSNPVQFVAKWQRVNLPERAASQEHFIDLCRMLGQPTPAQHDATGAEYTFEKGVPVTGAASAGSQGERGFADVWWRGKFALEYKRRGKYKTLTEAYRQLCQYREALDNPPLLIVSDIERTEIHTNFTGTAKQVHAIELVDFAKPESIDLLRRIFTNPDSFKPTLTPEHVTTQIAKDFGQLAEGLRNRGHDPLVAAHFLMKCMFCLFAEDVALLPTDLFMRLLKSRRNNCDQLRTGLDELFNKMRTGGAFGVDQIPWFNGGLFDESPALELLPAEVTTLLRAAEQDWASVEPAIFGTLFERSLDPNTRAQIGAHYTSRDDIMLVVEPVILAPLRREWGDVKAKVEEQLQRRRRAEKGSRTTRTQKVAEKKIGELLDGFVQRLASISILDPACGSGNFLYVAIQQLLDLEKEVITFAARPEIANPRIPHVRPTQLHGIEINPYAAELAQVVIWIGYLQWMRDNGFVAPSNPILEPLQTIENRDAILDLSKPDLPVAAQWPKADFIIGNPPFLGFRLFGNQGLQREYVEALHSCFEIPNGSDLCCYWLELARQYVDRLHHLRVGLLATQGIRGGDNRQTLTRILKSHIIYNAWSDRKWVLDGAAVQISIICFAKEPLEPVTLDGIAVDSIHADLSGDINLTRAKAILSNASIVHQGVVTSGEFDVDWESARLMMASPNPVEQSNVDVVRPTCNALDVARRPRSRWIVDFGLTSDQKEAASYELPFQHAITKIKPDRDSLQNGKRKYAHSSTYPFWVFWRPRPDMRKALSHLRRFLVTIAVSKHRLFAWMPAEVLPNHAAFAFARSDDYFFGVLHSSIHELWALRMGTQLEDRPRYTPTTCFETFPLPWPPGAEPKTHPAHQAISDAARVLNEQRERWLNPPEWIEPIAAAIDAEDDFADVPEDARPLIRQSAIMARAAKDKRLKKRTLTNLYNERPTWLRLAHQTLDRAVLAAYAVVDPDGDWDASWAHVWIDTGAGQPLPAGHDLAERRAHVDQQVLTNLLRLNLARADAE